MNLSLQTEQHVISWDHHLSGSNPRQDSHIAAHSISLRSNLFSQGLLGRPGHHPLKKWLYGSKFLNPPKWTYQNWICSYMIPIYLTSKLVSLWWSHRHLGPFSVIHRAKGASPTKPWHKLGSWWWVIDVFCGLCMLQRVKKNEAIAEWKATYGLWFMFAKGHHWRSATKIPPWPTSKHKVLSKIVHGNLLQTSHFRLGSKPHLYSRSHGFFQRSTKLSTRLSDDLLCISFSFTTERKSNHWKQRAKTPQMNPNDSWQDSNLFAK